MLAARLGCKVSLLEQLKKKRNDFDNREMSFGSDP